MCWNAEVSLNTFLFSSFVLGLVMYNNLYTQYKIPELNNVWIYVFFASFIIMQLFEFFIWRNINNKFYNHIFSVAATLLLLFQPIASLMILSNITIRNTLLIIYISFTILYSIYKFNTKNIHTTISKKTHLHWHFFGSLPIEKLVWLFFLFFSLFYEKKWYGILFGIITLIVFLFYFYKDNTAGSMWCWSINGFFILLSFYLLFYLPFREQYT